MKLSTNPVPTSGRVSVWIDNKTFWKKFELAKKFFVALQSRISFMSFVKFWFRKPCGLLITQRLASSRIEIHGTIQGKYRCTNPRVTKNMTTYLSLCVPKEMQVEGKSIAQNPGIHKSKSVGLDTK